MYISNNNMIIIRGHPPRKSIRRERSQTIFCTKILVLAREPYTEHCELNIKRVVCAFQITSVRITTAALRRRQEDRHTKNNIIYFHNMPTVSKGFVESKHRICNLCAWKKTRFVVFYYDDGVTHTPRHITCL